MSHACAECGAGELERDPDVLDTWFSSALWPFATLGWPADTPELDRYYRGDVNSTAREIIRLWENRMIFSGLFLLGEIPFTDVLIHSTVLAADGRRMSKSLGTGVDPMQPIDAHGADRIATGSSRSRPPRTCATPSAPSRGPQARNKLWNVGRLVQQAEGVEPAGGRPRSSAGSSRASIRRGRPSRTTGRGSSAAATGVLYHLTFDDFRLVRRGRRSRGCTTATRLPRTPGRARSPASLLHRCAAYHRNLVAPPARKGG
jgi:hypothetical protein